MLSPNGHGGSIDALGHEGTLEWLRFLGVGYVSYFQVDNALVNPADPLFLGFQDLMGAEMTAKVVTKAHPEERAGVVAVVNGRPGVVEYSEISREDACARDPDGSLRYDLANIAAHGFSLGFLDRVRGVGLPYHTAVKKVPTVDADGSPVVLPGRKFETFVFDAIPLADGFLAYRTKREEEFAPLKNREGDDSPATVRQALLDRTRHWYRAAGLSPPDRMEDLEMSPLRAYDEETFRDWLREHRGGPRP
jgi:UDP-N-acetylglucosamine/UDP-N-acetylgalactosamine diphosphorylase